MAQIYQEVIAVTISKLIHEKENETPTIIADELMDNIENLVEEYLDDKSLVVEATKIEE